MTTAEHRKRMGVFKAEVLLNIANIEKSLKRVNRRKDVTGKEISKGNFDNQTEDNRLFDLQTLLYNFRSKLIEMDNGKYW